LPKRGAELSFGDMLTAIHRLLRGEGERFRPRTANLGFDRERQHEDAVVIIRDTLTLHPRAELAQNEIAEMKGFADILRGLCGALLTVAALDPATLDADEMRSQVNFLLDGVAR
jgi:hypothetical protein